MKFSLVAIAFAAAVSAQGRSDIPECALPCLDDVIKSKTTCSTDDYSCVCAHFTELQGDATPCVLEKCGADTALNKVLPAVSKVCAAVSAAPSSSAAAATSSAGSSAASTSASASKSAATTPASSTGTTKPTSNPNPTTASPSTLPTTGAAGAIAPLGALALGALAFAL